MRQGTQVNIQKTSYTDPRFKLYSNLQVDAARFATFREAQRERELEAVKTDLDKKRINQKYAEFLKTEKQTIFANAAAAERWMGFAENADIYPNLEFRTAGDSDVRSSHAKLEGLIVSLDDPYLRTHTTPIDWGCRCEWVQTDAPVNKSAEKYKGYDETPVGKGFDFNPGVDQRLFSKTAGYYTSAPKAEAKKLEKQAIDFASEISRNAVIEALSGQKITAKAKNLKRFEISNDDLKAVASGSHINEPLRNTLLFDIRSVIAEADFVNTTETGGVKVHNYIVRDYPNMIIHIEESESGALKLISITDR